MVLATGKYSFREASCCSVDVVKGAAGDLLAGLVLRSATLNFAETQDFKKASASSLVSKFEGSLAWKPDPSWVVNEATTL